MTNKNPICDCCGEAIINTDGPLCMACVLDRKRLELICLRLELLDRQVESLQKEYKKLTGVRWIAPIRL